MWPQPLTETDFVDVLVSSLRSAGQLLRLERSREHLLDALRGLTTEIEKQTRERLRELETLAWRDPLTGLLNRRAIEELADAELHQHASGRPLALGLIDADHFKEVNRDHLHTGGDQVLIGLARTLESVLRRVDAVGRIGGDEFLVVSPETDRAGATTLADRLRTAVEQMPFRCNGRKIEVTVSIGFAVVNPGDVVEFEQLKHAAAAALAEAKAASRNRSIIRVVESPVDPCRGEAGRRSVRQHVATKERAV